ncbi:MAG: RNA 2',3'-cyclic phosphodiesterase [Elusimicrobiota bacterium]
MRLFFAVEIQGPACGRLQEALRELASSRADVKWVSGGMHLTLAFLGETSESRLTAVKEAGARTALAAKPARASLTHLGAFPSWEKPRVLWAGVGPGPGHDALVDAARSLKGHLEAGGFQTEERGFTPHATLGRVRGPKGADRLLERAKKWRDEAAWKEASFEVKELSLINSVLGPDGPRHEAIERYPFQGEPA